MHTNFNPEEDPKSQHIDELDQNTSLGLPKGISAPNLHNHDFTGSDLPENDFVRGMLILERASSILDIKSAIEYLLRSHEAGYPLAAFELSELYLNGIYSVPNPDLAKSLLRTVMDIPFPAALYNYAVTELTPEFTSVPNYEEVIRCLKVAMQCDYPPASFRLGTLYIEKPELDRPTEEDPISLIQHSAEIGFVPAMAWLGNYYWNNDNGQRNIESSSQYFLMAAERGDLESIRAMTHFHNLGALGDKSSLHEAARLSKIGAKLGDTSCLIGYCLFSVRSGYDSHAPEQVLMTLQQLAARGAPEGLTGMGFALLNGYGIPKNVAQAEIFFERAGNFPMAQFELSKILIENGYSQERINRGIALMHSLERYSHPDVYQYLKTLYSDGTYITQSHEKATYYTTLETESRRAFMYKGIF